MFKARATGRFDFRRWRTLSAGDHASPRGEKNSIVEKLLQKSRLRA